MPAKHHNVLAGCLRYSTAPHGRLGYILEPADSRWERWKVLGPCFCVLTTVRPTDSTPHLLPAVAFAGP